jgi:hypothetical protein
MSGQSNQSPEVNRLAKVPVRLNELLERGEISPEAFALYTAMAEALSSNVVPIDLDEREVSVLSYDRDCDSIPDPG